MAEQGTGKLSTKTRTEQAKAADQNTSGERPNYWGRVGFAVMLMLLWAASAAYLVYLYPTHTVADIYQLNYAIVVMLIPLATLAALSIAGKLKD